MLEYVRTAHTATKRRAWRRLSIAILSTLVACAQPDVTSPTREPQSKGDKPALAPLPPWNTRQPSAWAPSELRGSLLFSQSQTLYRVTSDSAEPLPVLGFPYWPYAVHLSPDGTRAATLHFDEVSQVLCVVQTGADGGRRCVRIETPGGSALAWTPDGEALALGGGAPAIGASARLSIVDPVTLEIRTLLPSDGNEEAQSVSFTPDARTVSFVLNSQLWRMPMNGDGVRQLQPGFEAMQELGVARWSPDGQMIALLAWNAAGQTLSVARADGSHHRTLAHLPHVENTWGQMFDRPVWSPDGAWLGLTHHDCINYEPCAQRIVVFSVSNKGYTVLPHEGLLHDWR